MKMFCLYFSDLNEDAQSRLLKTVGSEDPKDENWDLDILPLAVLHFEEENER